MRPGWTRRDLLKGGALASAGLLACSPRSLQQTPSTPPPDFTAAFLTDPHVYARKGAPEGLRLCVDHAFAQERPPELVIYGGDIAFDILDSDQAGAEAQYDLFDSVAKGVKVPVHHTLGNHDCFGVRSAEIGPSHPLYGKTYFAKRFGLERTYHAFDHEGWHFVVLDTIGLTEDGYRGWVDEEQLGWLADDLAASTRPTVVIGHVPLVSNFLEWRAGTSQGASDTLTVANAQAVTKILEQHPVQLVLAGHLHIVESYTYKGMELANLGAICGNWWNGERDGFQEGYSLLEFRGDRVSWRYVDYGWDARA